MGSTSSCDSADECVIRGCQFSKHSNGEINHGEASIDANESNKQLMKEVDLKLDTFFRINNTAKRKTINELRTLITGKDTKDMDINADCIDFNNVFKKENFTYNTSTGSLIACTIIGIVFIVAAIFVWRWFVRRNESSIVASMPRSIGTDNGFTIKRV